MLLKSLRTKSGHKGRLLVHPDELLQAIDKAFAENPKEGMRSIPEVATLIARRYIAMDEARLKVFIRRQLSDQQRSERNIAQPKRYAVVE